MSVFTYSQGISKWIVQCIPLLKDFALFHSVHVQNTVRRKARPCLGWPRGRGEAQCAVALVFEAGAELFLPAV